MAGNNACNDHMVDVAYSNHHRLECIFSQFVLFLWFEFAEAVVVADRDKAHNRWLTTVQQK